MDRSRLPLACLIIALAAAGCGGDPTPGGGGVSDAATTDGVSAGPFALNPARCPPTEGLRSAIRTAFEARATQAEDALVAAGYEAVTATDAAGIPGGMAAVDARGDIALVLPDGHLAVVSSCGLDSLGQVHRLDDALQRLATAMAKHSFLSAEAQVQAWALPDAIYGARAYERHAVAAGTDLNGARTGELALAGGAQLGFIIAGAPEGSDVVGVARIAVDGGVVIPADTRVVTTPLAMRWPLPRQPGAGTWPLEVELVATGSGLAGDAGRWGASVEALFDAEGGLSFTLHGAGAGRLLVSKPVAAAGLPASLTRLRDDG